MEKLRHEWIAEFESVPPGNGTESDRWASTVGEAARTAMSTSERDAHEEKKLKLRKAIPELTNRRSELGELGDSFGDRRGDARTRGRADAGKIMEHTTHPSPRLPISVSPRLERSETASALTMRVKPH
ncbi:MAG: hypothetical protein BRC48_02730 [Cyanobacteria bacterium QS_9_48_30]|nr:MAG: hypothetical protein BRC48_02730 [Cyanobacteria bacterium QS_9_48_30]